MRNKYDTLIAYPTLQSTSLFPIDFKYALAFEKGLNQRNSQSPKSEICNLLKKNDLV